VLHSERDHAFAAQADDIRAAYSSATIRVLRGAGHGALFTHTDQSVGEIQTFLAAPTTPRPLAAPQGGPLRSRLSLTLASPICR
jgi:hypothetical protein